MGGSRRQTDFGCSPRSNFETVLRSQFPVVSELRESSNVHRTFRGRICRQEVWTAYVDGRAAGGAAVSGPALGRIPAARLGAGAHRPGKHALHAAGSLSLSLVAQSADGGGVGYRVCADSITASRATGRERPPFGLAWSVTGCSTGSAIGPTCRCIRADRNTGWVCGTRLPGRWWWSWG